MDKTFNELPYTNKHYKHRTIDVPYHDCVGFNLLMENDTIYVINAVASNPINNYYLGSNEIHFCPSCGGKL